MASLPKVADYFFGRVDNQSGGLMTKVQISEEATDVNKQIFVTLERIDGEKIRVPLNQLEEFIWVNKGSLKTEKIE